MVMRLTMRDPAMMLLAALPQDDDHELFANMLRAILMDGDAVKPTDPIAKVYKTSKDWIPILEDYFLDHEVDAFYDMLNAIAIVDG